MVIDLRIDEVVVSGVVRRGGIAGGVEMLVMDSGSASTVGDGTGEGNADGAASVTSGAGSGVGSGVGSGEDTSGAGVLVG